MVTLYIIVALGVLWSVVCGLYEYRNSKSFRKAVKRVLRVKLQSPVRW